MIISDGEAIYLFTGGHSKGGNFLPYMLQLSEMI